MMSTELIGETVDRLVATRYPYEVDEVLASITDPGDLTIVVATALARSCDLGRRQGRELERDRLRRSLGLDS